MPFKLLRGAPEILEERGNNWFRPARPAPHSKPLGTLDLVLGMRRNLISTFAEADYVSHNFQLRIFGRQVVVVNQPETIRHVLVANNSNFSRKSPQLRRALEYLVGDGLFISDGETWRRRRPLMADIVHRRRLPTLTRSMEAAIADLVERWEDKPQGATFDVLPEMAELTAEIISQAVFGQKLGSAAAHKVIEGFTSYQRLIDSTNLGYFLGADKGWPVVRGPRLRKAIAQIHEVIDKVIAAHIEQDQDENSLVGMLLRRQARSPELGLTINELRSEAHTMFMAGHEGTTVTLAWMWYLLANAPWVESAIHAEIKAVVGSRPPTLADIPKLDWCRSVVEETLRLYPSIPILARQALAADKVGPINVEPGALIVVLPWLLHRARDLWERADDFLPERFLGGKKPEPYTYLPFSAGPRICPGASFGLTEAILCLATLAQRFKVRIAPGFRVEPYCRLTLRPKEGLKVVLEHRG